MMNATKVSPSSDTINPAASQKLQEVEKLTNELKSLLVRHEVALNEEGIHREVEILERWMESYRRGLAAANKISASGIGWLSQLRDQLKMAAEEKQRLEDEGGNPATKEQMQKTHELFGLVKRLDKAIADIDQILNFTAVTEDA
jgi:uncharacterized FlaG/YvyC family protein